MLVLATIGRDGEASLAEVTRRAKRSRRLVVGAVALCVLLLAGGCDESSRGSSCLHDEYRFRRDDEHYNYNVDKTTSLILPTTTTTTLPGDCVYDFDCDDVGVGCYCSFNVCHCSLDFRLVDVDFELLSPVPFGALQVAIAYAAPGVEFQGNDDQVRCTSLVEALSSFNDDAEADVLSAGFISLLGVGGATPVPLMSCVLVVRSDFEPTVGHFTVGVIDASDVNVVPIIPPPTVTVARFRDHTLP